MDAIITKYNFADLKPVSIPMDPNIQLSHTQTPKSVVEIACMKHIPYWAAIGSLMHLAVGTWPDIVFAVSTVAQFSMDPGLLHWEAMKRIYRYLIGMKKLALTFGMSHEHWHAITGYVYILDGGAVSWVSKKQELVTLSTTEAEYVAATHAAKEGIWLHHLVRDVFCLLSHPTCQNQVSSGHTRGSRGSGY